LNARAISADGIDQHQPHRDYLLAWHAQDVQIIPGKGVTGRFEGRSFWFGSHRYLEECAQETPEIHAQAEALEREGRTVIAIGNEAHVCGLITIADSGRSGERYRHLLCRLHEAERRPEPRACS